ncbi:hypothetical protein BCD64_22700 [Nostoc sp. MBR 210]|nr:hypothetical protein BCD64_22700 [Nostoc sp. MBR 210]
MVHGVLKLNVQVLRVNVEPFYSKVEVLRVNVEPFYSKVGVLRVNVEPFYSKVGVLRVKGEALGWKCQKIFCVGCCGMGDFLTQRRRGAERKTGVFEFFDNLFAKIAESGMIYLTVISEQSTVISNIF